MEMMYEGVGVGVAFLGFGSGLAFMIWALSKWK